ncbi:Cj0814 family flagellar-dependent secreted protein [Campylobacter coli]|uniref:Cj0814 family flagellar-dependent secreted protein n=1 Tax=Campylobacter coli TaxID=195 RepID=UPI003F169D7A
MSIFSINDNSNYTSILSQAKANKESKENSKISFANAFLKQNANKLNEIQSKNSQTLARSEILNSTNTTNTSNNTNFSISSKTSSPNYDISSEFKNSIYTLKYKQVDLSTDTAYGYSVDKDGYMGSDFNKAAGLPEDFKIHKSTLDEIYNFNEAQYQDIKEQLGISRYFTNIDMADTIKQYYNQFNQIVNHTFNDTNKTSFTEADINSMPSGYGVSGTQSMDFNDPSNRMNITHLRDFSNSLISNVYQTPEQAKEANEIWFDSGCMIKGLSSETLGLSLEEIKNVSKGEDWQFNPDMSVYPQNEDGSYSKEALFMSFLKSQGGQPIESPKTTLNPTIEAYNRAMAKESFSGPAIHLDSIMTGKSDFKSFFRYWAERGIAEGDLYMYENNIPKESAMGNWALDAEIKQAIANGWKAKPSTINSYADSIMDRLNNLIGQTRV